jgi:hypothetical protein
MHWFRFWRHAAVLGLVLALDSLVQSQPSAAQQGHATLTIAGRALRCGNVRNVFDPRLPNIGMAAPGLGLLVLNPHLLQRQPPTVRLFVYHHECGHHHVGGDEVAADCWAARQGARQGWLGPAGIEQICRSFGNRPATVTHPSGASRCASLRRCFAEATGAGSAADAKAKGGATRFVGRPRSGRSSLGRPPD